jgi:hypothetical protein
MWKKILIYFGYHFEPSIEILCFKNNLFQILATCFQKLIALVQQTKKKKPQNFPSDAKFCTRKKGLIRLSYLPAHASSWNLDNGTHSITTYGSTIVVMLIHVMWEVQIMGQSTKSIQTSNYCAHWVGRTSQGANDETKVWDVIWKCHYATTLADICLNIITLRCVNLIILHTFQM